MVAQLRKTYPQPVDKLSYQQQLSFYNFNRKKRDEIYRIGNKSIFYKPCQDKVYRLYSLVHPMNLDWKDILEKFENLFQKKVESYSQFVDNFIWIRKPLCA